MPTEDELNCQQVVELVTDYLENTLLPEMHERLKAHVATCPGCENYIEQVQLTIDMLHQIARESVFPSTKQELLQLFQDWKKSSEAQETDSP
jgi:predicted anti-sigma-YlaC factor YlaD